MPNNDAVRQELTDTLTTLLKRLSDWPDNISVEVDQTGAKDLSYVIKVPAEERGMLIGRRGRIMYSVRTIMRSIATKHQYRVFINLEGEMEDMEPYDGEHRHGR